ncbi:PB1 domain, RWP-RK domain protein [Artemisia annua]|uniref:PB1 domain, RWP-RK domain protein n=1 Tax=Artemisia annua TaxID=35608 RepID=A0A2U1KUH0_ARTAN|nr:PB1 domain, RWP-RK domain protein [Artemisia annua]
MDFDLDGSLSTYDKIFSPTPSQLFIVSTVEQPLSPLWAFPIDNNNVNLNDDDDNPTETDTLTSSRADPLVITGLDDPDQVPRKTSTNDGKSKPPMPILELNPPSYQDPRSVIKERMTKALRYFIELGEQHVLVQSWAPVKNKGHYVLTTSGQPFVFDPNCTGLHQYRMASLMYVFSLDGKTDGELDVPGRVFRHKLPEWTPNVQYYSDKEYPRLNHALSYNVRGTLALPVFEPSGQSCVGVLELILTSQAINYAPVVDKICKALETVNLKSSNVLDSPNTEAISNESQQQALAEILEVLEVVCETNNFPLAQTWVPCRHRSVLSYGGGFKKSCSSFDGSCMGQVCMSTTDVAFYVIDAHIWGFREACTEHHLQKGQGVAGRAFETRSSCFCENITHFSKTEYPLVHYARLFGLVASFAICLRSSHTGDDDYILEFFLPPNMVDCKDQQTMLGSLLISMKQHFRSLTVASGEEIGEDGRMVEIIKASVNGNVIDSKLEDKLQIIDFEDSSRSEIKYLKFSKENRLSTTTDASEEGRRPVVERCIQPSEAKYKTAPISLPREDIEKQFGRTMKEAAKNLNVSLSTLKRKCKDLDISEWQGPNFIKRKSNDSRSKQRNINEADKIAMRDSLANKREMQFDVNTLTIKAQYGDDTIKFQLPISTATIVAIEKEICDRFKLGRETYKLNYLDEDKDWILMTSDQDMRDCIRSSKLINSTALRLRVLLLT